MDKILVNTYDLEPWWATVPASIRESEWSRMTDRSDRLLNEFLELCEKVNVKATFFVVGWYAKKFPERIRRIYSLGHEIGCHSLFHEDVAEQNILKFRSTTLEAKRHIEDSIGANIISYRAPSFSIPIRNEMQFFQSLFELGFKIDSSICPSSRLYGGYKGQQTSNAPTFLNLEDGGRLFEIPVAGVRVFNRDIQVVGGGYLRLIPLSLVKRFVRDESYQVLYLHPHDFDVFNPPIPNASFMNFVRRNLKVGNLKNKLLYLYASFEVVSCNRLLEYHERNL